MLTANQLEPSFEWDCQQCIFDLPMHQKGTTWGFYDDIAFGCEACKAECNKHERCSAVQCYEVNTSSDNSDISSRSNFLELSNYCMWMSKSINVANQSCKDNFNEDHFLGLTCTRRLTRK